MLILVFFFWAELKVNLGGAKSVFDRVCLVFNVDPGLNWHQNSCLISKGKKYADILLAQQVLIGLGYY